MIVSIQDFSHFILTLISMKQQVLRRFFSCVSLASFMAFGSTRAQTSSSEISTRYSETTQKIIKECSSDSIAFDRMAYLCDTFGHRISGSEALEKSLDWIVTELRKDGFDNVHTEEVTVPHWVRGEERCAMLEPRKADVPMLGLGGSIATPKGGITAEVFVVHSFEELAENKSKAKGKIVLFNVPFTSYGKTVAYRSQGAIKAAEAGAIASLIRSVGPFSIRSPHTGMMRYNDTIPKIPHAAISSEDAEMFDRMQKRGQKVVVKLEMSAQTLPDARSRNVIAEIRGSEKPNEIVVMGGHIDSWDVGTGAMDDAGGCISAWRALLAIKRLGLRPKRTVRVVFWTNEENGLKGGATYALNRSPKNSQEKHILALESDEGAFTPRGFGLSTKDATFRKKVEAVAGLLSSINATIVEKNGGGADIGPLADYDVPQMNLETAGERYFWFHHTHGDTPDKLDPKDMNLCSAAMAVMTFCIADLP